MCGSEMGLCACPNILFRRKQVNGLRKQNRGRSPCSTCYGRSALVNQRNSQRGRKQTLPAEAGKPPHKASKISRISQSLDFRDLRGKSHCGLVTCEEHAARGRTDSGTTPVVLSRSSFRKLVVNVHGKAIHQLHAGSLSCALRVSSECRTISSPCVSQGLGTRVGLIELELSPVSL